RAGASASTAVVRVGLGVDTEPIAHGVLVEILQDAHVVHELLARAARGLTPCADAALAHRADVATAAAVVRVAHHGDAGAVAKRVTYVRTYADRGDAREPVVARVTAGAAVGVIQREVDALPIAKGVQGVRTLACRVDARRRAARVTA